MGSRRRPVNYALLFPYTLPYFAYVVVLGRGVEMGGRVVGYALAAAAAGIALVWGRRWLLPLRGARGPLASVALGALAGLFGTALWVALKTPFLPSESSDPEPWNHDAFLWRLGVSTLIVPFAEEWLFRGFLFRGATQYVLARRAGEADPLGKALHESSVDELPAHQWTVFALVFSSVVFAAGHAPSEWVAASAYGLLMGGLVILRGDLLCAVVAHGVTNLTLAVYIRQEGLWTVW